MKFFAGTLFLLLALILQFWFASTGLVIDFVFTVLIVFGFIFEFWELLFFILLSLFIINWQPAPSITLAVFGVIPLLAYASRKLFSLQAWAGNFVAIAVGLFLLYLSVSPTLLFTNLRVFFIDLAVSLAFGSCVFYGLRYSHRQ